LEPFKAPEEEGWPGTAFVLDGFVAGLPAEEDEEVDDAEEVSPAPAAEVLLPPELREAHPAKAARTTAVVATVFTRDFIVLHLLAESVTGIWTQWSAWRFPSIFIDLLTGHQQSAGVGECQGESAGVTGTVPRSPLQWLRRTGPIT
jgi:hypothetical protein